MNETEDKPIVITICGSTKFKEEQVFAAEELTRRGNIVLMCPIFPHADSRPLEETNSLHELHLRRIDISDAIFVVNKEGYIGESTKKEILYAETTGKKVMYMFIGGRRGDPYDYEKA